MPAKSKDQQKFMGQVYAYKKGELKNPSKEVKEAAKSMSKEDAKDYAETDRKGLPEDKDSDNEKNSSVKLLKAAANKAGVYKRVDNKTSKKQEKSSAFHLGQIMKQAEGKIDPQIYESVLNQYQQENAKRQPTQVSPLADQQGQPSPEQSPLSQGATPEDLMAVQAQLQQLVQSNPQIKQQIPPHQLFQAMLQDRALQKAQLR